MFKQSKVYIIKLSFPRKVSFLCLKLHRKKQTQRKMAWRKEDFRFKEIYDGKKRVQPQ